MPITNYGVKSIIGAALKAAAAQHRGLSQIAYYGETTLSPGQIEDLSFLGNLPAMRVWSDNLDEARPVEFKGEARVERYALPFSLPNDWVEDDKGDNVARVLSQVGPRVDQLHADLIAGILNYNTYVGPLCFDGVALFSDSHTFGESGTIDNLVDYVASTAGAPTPYEVCRAVFAAWQNMLGFKDDRGQPVNENITKLGVVVGSAMAAAHAIALNPGAKTVSDGSGPVDNPLGGLRAQGIEIELIATPRYEDADGMVTLNMSPGSAPIVVLENTKKRKTMHEDESARKDQQFYNVRRVLTAAPGLFTDAIHTTYTDS